MKNLNIILCASLLTAGVALAQNSLTLESAVKTALARGADVVSSQQTLQSAQIDLQTLQSDPTTLVVALTQAQQAVALDTVKLNAQKISVLGNVSTAYLNLYEAQENLTVLNAQVALDSKNLDIAKAKLAQKNGTDLDVRKAQNTLAQSKQNLANQQAQLPTLSNKLEVLLGQGLQGNLNVADPPAFKEVKLDAAALEKALDTRLPSVLQAAQNVELQSLNVKLADNDYTPANTLATAKTNLQSAQLTLDTARKNAVTNLRDAVRTVSNALETVKLSQVSLKNEQDGLAQDQVRFKGGTISRVQLQQTELSVAKAQFGLTQAQDNYLEALNALSNAAGADVTGLLEKLGGGS